MSYGYYSVEDFRAGRRTELLTSEEAARVAEHARGAGVGGGGLRDLDVLARRQDRVLVARMRALTPTIARLTPDTLPEWQAAIDMMARSFEWQTR